MYKFTLGATIPTAQYSNLQPVIETEAETPEEARALALAQMQEVWNNVCEPGKELRVRGSQPAAAGRTTEMIDIFTGKVLFLDGDHVYRDEEGKKYTSGSLYGKQFGYPFDTANILPKYAAKFEQDPDEIKAFWDAKSKASTDFGTALHQALEVYGKYLGLVKKLSTEEKPVELGIHPMLVPAVEAFFRGRENENAIHEGFVTDVQNLRCGEIDRIVITGDKRCIIQDYKTNRDLHKAGSPKYLKAPFDKTGATPLLNEPLSGYVIQLNFYRGLLESQGWTVEGMEVHHFGENGWELVPVQRVDLP